MKQSLGCDCIFPPSTRVIYNRINMIRSSSTARITDSSKWCLPYKVPAVVTACTTKFIIPAVVNEIDWFCSTLIIQGSTKKKKKNTPPLLFVFWSSRQWGRYKKCHFINSSRNCHDSSLFLILTQGKECRPFSLYFRALLANHRWCALSHTWYDRTLNERWRIPTNCARDQLLTELVAFGHHEYTL